MTVKTDKPADVLGRRRVPLGLLALLTISAVGKADRIKGGAGNDRIKGRQGRDWLLGGKGADRIKAADGQKDRAVRGGPGADTCTVDAADRRRMKGYEKVKVRGGGGAAGCVAPQPDRAIAVDDAQSSTGASARRGDPPPTFSEAFDSTTITLNASSDGAADGHLPISIEDVCDVPKALQAEALQLVGNDAVAIIGPATTVFQNGIQLEGEAAMMALADLDAVEVRARLLRPSEWVQDEDGNPVPTFDAIRITIVD